jgi:uncharacterized protein YndB with AHSA1/START domain
MTSDRIEREIVIDAPVDRVWSFVTQSAFWVYADDPRRGELREGAVFVAEHPEFGRFPVRIERIEPMHYLSYRWASTFPGEEPGAGNSTLIEFTLRPDGDQTRLRVVETGFDSLSASLVRRQASYQDNVQGWTGELEALRLRVERQGAGQR